MYQMVPEMRLSFSWLFVEEKKSVAILFVAKIEPNLLLTLYGSDVAERFTLSSFHLAFVESLIFVNVLFEFSPICLTFRYSTRNKIKYMKTNQ